MTDAEILAAFSPDYAIARDRFRQTADRAGWAISTYATGDVGPGGEALTIDVAMSPSATRPDHVFVLSSGLHGIEGHFGSAAQVSALETFASVIAVMHRTRCVLVHALNPFGFAWSRRSDAHNVDLNRAFRTPGMETHEIEFPRSATSPGFLDPRLDRLLNPRHPPSRMDAFRLRLLGAAIRRGPFALRRAVASGQRVNPAGMFFAGAKAPPLQELLERELPLWVGGASTVVHLDLHTGLGRSGRGALIVDYPMRDEARAWMIAAFGADAVRESLRDSRAYTAGGSLGQWCMATMRAPRYKFAFAEFGTLAGPSVLAGLRAENQVHHWAAASDPIVATTKARLRDLFCPPQAAWRLSAVRGVLDLVDRTLRRLGSDPRGPAGI